MSLRLITPGETRAPASRWIRVPSVRPGEPHEPVRLVHGIAAELTSVAGAGGVPSSVALAVLLEAELAARAVAEAGGTTSLVGSHSDRSVSLPVAQLDYLEFISQLPRDNAFAQPPARPSAEVLPVPVRLLPFCDESLLRVATRRDLSQAMRWEEHAVRSGRTLTEWVLRQALMAVAAAGRR